MDPIQAVAARQVSLTRSRAEDIDAFYDAHAFASLHGAMRSFKRLAPLIREMRSQTVRKSSAASDIASVAHRA